MVLFIWKICGVDRRKKPAMEGIKEKFTVEITQSGVDILGGEGQVLHFSAVEALMLLDILRNEEAELKRMAEESTPVRIKIKV